MIVDYNGKRIAFIHIGGNAGTSIEHYLWGLSAQNSLYPNEFSEGGFSYTETIRDNSDFTNPYAKAKAMAAYHIASKIPEINTKACFMEKESEKFIPLVTCAHEMAQVAAKLAEEAREIEKYTDTLVRKPHSKKGEPLTKTKLMQSPEFDDELYKKWLKTLPGN